MVDNQPIKRKLMPPTKEAVKPAVHRVKSRKSNKLFGVLLRPLRIFRVLRFLVPPYVKNSFNELRQVTWPSRRETIKLTFAVFMFAIIFGALITITDFGLDKIFKKVLLK